MCARGKKLDFFLRFLAMAELMQASLCSFGLTKTLYFLQLVCSSGLRGAVVNAVNG